MDALTNALKSEQPAKTNWKEKTTTEKTAALEGAFRKLPIRMKKGPYVVNDPKLGTITYDNAIPYESLIPGIARELMLMGPEPRPKASARKAKKELKSLVQLTVRYVKALDELSQRAIDALNTRSPVLQEWKLTKTLRFLAGRSRNGGS